MTLYLGVCSNFAKITFNLSKNSLEEIVLAGNVLSRPPTGRELRLMNIGGQELRTRDRDNK